MSTTTTLRRIGVRLLQPDPRTVEQFTSTGSGTLQLSIQLPYGTVSKYNSLMNPGGPDAVTISFSDDLGQPLSWTANMTLWATDAGWAFIGSDGLTQFLISGVSGPFFDEFAAVVNARNTAAAATPLTPCANPRRYDDCTLLLGQVRPWTFIRDGVLISSSSGSGSPL